MKWHDAVDPGPGEESPSGERRILSVRQINEAISTAMDQAFPATVWVRGEVQRLPADAARRTHVYFELHETGGSGAAEYQIPTSLMGWDRQRFGLGRYLDGSDPDFQIANKIEVCLECKVDFYAKFGKLSLKVVGVDKNFSLGRLEARRRETLAFLKEAALLERNAGLRLPELPLRIGLITAPGSAAERDFMTGIEASPWAFTVTLAGARMQGEQLQAEVMAALTRLVGRGPDVIVITRGGGSRADLSWFDQKDLAVAIAECPLPVITAIGHEIDTSIADLVAHHACKTPTAAAEFLVERVDIAAARIGELARQLADLAATRVDEARRRSAVTDRLARAVDRRLLQARMACQGLGTGLQTRVAHRLDTERSGLGDLGLRLGTTAVRRVGQGRTRLAGLQDRAGSRAAAVLDRGRRTLAVLDGRLRREAPRPVDRSRARLDSLSKQVRLADPRHLLIRGYTITTGPAGRAVASAAALAPGDRIRTRFADGEVASIVQPGKDLASKTGKDNARGGKKDEPEKDTGQKTLFR
jgi:exodeoxyribonuclease VII large subunit